MIDLTGAMELASDLLRDAQKQLAEKDAEIELLRTYLTAISSPTQTSDLLWWQRAARDALNTPDKEP